MRKILCVLVLVLVTLVVVTAETTTIKIGVDGLSMDAVNKVADVVATNVQSLSNQAPKLTEQAITAYMAGVMSEKLVFILIGLIGIALMFTAAKVTKKYDDAPDYDNTGWLFLLVVCWVTGGVALIASLAGIIGNISTWARYAADPTGAFVLKLLQM